MRELIFFLAGFTFAIIMTMVIVFVFKRAGILVKEIKSNDFSKTPKLDKHQKELERQYNNLMNYDGRVQRGADDEN